MIIVHKVTKNYELLIMNCELFLPLHILLGIVIRD